jgi:nitrogen fixation NifU-like protein
MEVYIKVENDLVADVKFRTFGCAAAIASASMASEMAMGQTLEAATRLTDEQVAEALGGLPEAKLHCSNLAATALHAALDDYYARHPDPRPIPETERV